MSVQRRSVDTPNLEAFLWGKFPPITPIVIRDYTRIAVLVSLVYVAVAEQSRSLPNCFVSDSMGSFWVKHGRMLGGIATSGHCTSWQVLFAYYCSCLPLPKVSFLLLAILACHSPCLKLDSEL